MVSHWRGKVRGKGARKKREGEEEEGAREKGKRREKRRCNQHTVPFIQ